MAGKLIIDTIQTENSFLQLNVSNTRVATMNASGIYSNTGTKMIGSDGTISAIISANTVANSSIQTGAIENYLNSQNLNFGMRNRIINGAFGIWQRGTSGAITTSTTYVAADRWGVDQASSAAATLSQSLSVPTAVAQYSAKVQRNNANTGTNNIVIAQALETSHSFDLAGQSATLSFYAKAGANFSASSSTLNFNVFYGQGTDQSLASMRTNSWTGQTNTGSSVSLTTTWTRYTITVSVPSGTTQMGLQFYFTPVGTAGADDAFYITGVQLEKGGTATSFDYRPYGTELQLCQRYYQVIGSPSAASDVNTMSFKGYNSTSNYDLFSLPLLTQMRTDPTTTKVGTWAVTNCGQPSVTGQSQTSFSFQIQITSTGAYVATSNNSGYFTFSAEL